MVKRVIKNYCGEKYLLENRHPEPGEEFIYLSAKGVMNLSAYIKIAGGYKTENINVLFDKPFVCTSIETCELDTYISIKYNEYFIDLLSDSNDVYTIIKVLS